MRKNSVRMQRWPLPICWASVKNQQYIFPQKSFAVNKISPLILVDCWIIIRKQAQKSRGPAFWAFLGFVGESFWDPLGAPCLHVCEESSNESRITPSANLFIQYTYTFSPLQLSRLPWCSNKYISQSIHACFLDAKNTHAVAITSFIFKSIYQLWTVRVFSPGKAGVPGLS